MCSRLIVTKKTLNPSQWETYEGYTSSTINSSTSSILIISSQVTYSSERMSQHSSQLFSQNSAWSIVNTLKLGSFPRRWIKEDITSTLFVGTVNIMSIISMILSQWLEWRSCRSGGWISKSRGSWFSWRRGWRRREVLKVWRMLSLMNSLRLLVVLDIKLFLSRRRSIIFVNQSSLSRKSPSSRARGQNWMFQVLSQRGRRETSNRWKRWVFEETEQDIRSFLSNRMRITRHLL